MNDFQNRIIDEFRQHDGKVGGMFEGAALLLLTTTGARSGHRHTVPLAYFEIDGRTVVIGSAMGAPTHPAWYHNLRADPQVSIEVGTETHPATAEILTGDDYKKVFAEVLKVAPGYADYQARTTRQLPVVALHHTQT